MLCGLINRACPPARSVWQAWERAKRQAQCRAVRTGDTRQLEWLERAKAEFEMGVRN